MTHADRRPAGGPRTDRGRCRAAHLGDVEAGARSRHAVRLLSAQARLEGVARSLVAFFAPLDAILTPALGRRPVPIGEIHGLGPDPMGHYPPFGRLHALHRDRQRHRATRRSRCPSTRATTGCRRPIQLIGPPAREEVLLQLGHQLEQALPWAGRTPALEAGAA